LSNIVSRSLIPAKLCKAVSSEITVSTATSNLGSKDWISAITVKALSTSVDKVCNSEYRKYPAPINRVKRTIWEKRINLSKLD